MKKRNLKKFPILGKSIKTEIAEKVVQLKEELTLLSRFLITEKKRPDLYLKRNIGNHEFPVVANSVFTSDGQLLHSFDKAKIFHAMDRSMHQ